VLNQIAKFKNTLLHFLHK